jgi:hypothetical protein
VTQATPGVRERTDFGPGVRGGTDLGPWVRGGTDLGLGGHYAAWTDLGSCPLLALVPVLDRAAITLHCTALHCTKQN